MIYEFKFCSIVWQTTSTKQQILNTFLHISFKIVFHKNNTRFPKEHSRPPQWGASHTFGTSGQRVTLAELAADSCELGNEFSDSRIPLLAKPMLVSQQGFCLMQLLFVIYPIFFWNPIAFTANASYMLVKTTLWSTLYLQEKLSKGRVFGRHNGGDWTNIGG
jgi:hypothetical protein